MISGQITVRMDERDELTYSRVVIDWQGFAGYARSSWPRADTSRS
jgi:hypothetical protein